VLPKDEIFKISEHPLITLSLTRSN